MEQGSGPTSGDTTGDHRISVDTVHEGADAEVATSESREVVIAASQESHEEGFAQQPEVSNGDRPTNSEGGGYGKTQHRSNDKTRAVMNHTALMASQAGGQAFDCSGQLYSAKIGNKVRAYHGVNHLTLAELDKRARKSKQWTSAQGRRRNMSINMSPPPSSDIQEAQLIHDKIPLTGTVWDCPNVVCKSSARGCWAGPISVSHPAVPVVQTRRQLTSEIEGQQKRMYDTHQLKNYGILPDGSKSPSSYWLEQSDRIKGEVDHTRTVRDTRTRRRHEMGLKGQIEDLLKDAQIPSFRRIKVIRFLQSVEDGTHEEKFDGERLRLLMSWREYLEQNIKDSDSSTERSHARSPTLRRQNRKNRGFSKMRDYDSVGQYAWPAVDMPEPPRLASERQGEMHFLGTMAPASAFGVSMGCSVSNSFESQFVSRTALRPASVGCHAGAVLL